MSDDPVLDFDPGVCDGTGNDDGVPCGYCYPDDIVGTPTTSLLREIYGGVLGINDNPTIGPKVLVIDFSSSW